MNHSMTAASLTFPEQLAAIPIGTIITWIISVIGVCVVIYKYMEKYRELRNKIADYEEAIDCNRQDIADLKRELCDMKTGYDNSFASINENINTVRHSVDQLIASQNSLLEYQHSRDRADLKDQIREYYDIYHRRQTITVREKETLIDLIDAYERAGGQNSFVHTLVLPEIATWTETA